METIEFFGAAMMIVNEFNTKCAWPTSLRNRRAIICLTCLGLLTLPSLSFAKLSKEYRQARVVAKRDAALGTVVAETDEAILFSKNLDMKQKTCSPYRLTDYPMPSAFVDPSLIQAHEQEQAEYEQAMKVHKARVAELEAPRRKWSESFMKIKVEYESKVVEAFREKNEAIARANYNATEDAKATAIWRKKDEELRKQYIDPLGEQPSAPKLPPEPEKPKPVTVAVAAVGFHLEWFDPDPLRPVMRWVSASGQTIDTEKDPLRGDLLLHPNDREYFDKHVLSLVTSVCPQAELVTLNLGFYDIVRSIGESQEPLNVATIDFAKVQGVWSVVGAGSNLMGRMSRSSVLFWPSEYYEKAGILYKPTADAVGQFSWLDREEYDYAYGHFLLPPNSVSPGIVNRGRRFWDQFEPESNAKYSDRVFESARMAFSGNFNIIPKDYVFYVAYSSLIEKYADVCGEQLQREDPVLFRRIQTEVKKDGFGGTERSSDLVAFEAKVAKRYLPALEIAVPEQFRMANVFAFQNLINPLAAVGEISRIVSQQKKAARKFFATEGCASPATRQLLDNYFRAIMEQPSLQSEAEGKNK